MPVSVPVPEEPALSERRRAAASRRVPVPVPVPARSRTSSPFQSARAPVVLRLSVLNRKAIVIPRVEGRELIERGARGRMTTYRDAGVDIDAQDQALARVKELVRSTYTDGVLSDQGSFGGMFRLPTKGLKEPVLVASADGVGTKLKVAFAAGRHDTVGQDLVNHCVNDILVQGARPLFFLDYLATGRLDPQVAAAVIGGVGDGLPRARHRAARRRDRRDAGLLRRRRVRPRRLHRRRGRPQEDPRRLGGGGGRSAGRPAVDRPPHQRLLARPQGLLRGPRLPAGPGPVRARGERRATSC